MYIITDFEDQLMREIDSLNRVNILRPINLWGVSGASGGAGGNFYGQLAQKYVAFDSSEGHDPTIPASGMSLITNLNRIRSGDALADGSILARHLASGIVVPSTAGITVAEIDDTPTLSGITKIKFTNAVVSAIDATTANITVTAVGSGSVPLFNARAVPYADASGILTQDPSNFVYSRDDATSTHILVIGADDNATAKLGYGGTGTGIHLIRDNVDGGFSLFTFSNSFTPNMTAYRARGSLASPQALLTGDVILRLTGRGYGTTISPTPRGRFQFEASEDWTDAYQGTLFRIYTTPNHTASATAYLEVSDKGDLKATGFIRGTSENDSALQVSSATQIGAEITTGYNTTISGIQNLGITGSADYDMVYLERTADIPPDFTDIHSDILHLKDRIGHYGIVDAGVGFIKAEDNAGYTKFLVDLDGNIQGRAIKLSNGAANGWALISDDFGNGTWQPTTFSGGGGGPHTLLSASHTDTTAASPVKGDIIIASGISAKWQRLPIGTDTEVLTVYGGQPEWRPAPSGGAGVSDHALLSNLDYASAGHTGFQPTLTNPVTGTGIVGRVAKFTGVSEIGTDDIVKSGAGTLTLDAGNNYTLTIPATGTAILGTGITNYISYWSGTNQQAGNSRFTFNPATGLVTHQGDIFFANDSPPSIWEIGCITQADTNVAGNALLIDSGAGNGSGNGGYLELSSGKGGDTGNGGNININSGDSGGTSGNGGDIIIKPGAGISADGLIKLGKNSAASVFAILDISSIATVNKTFTFPNITGTLALGAGTLTVSTTNNVSVASHTHAITSSANPGAAASILATDSSGNLVIGGEFRVTNTAPTISLLDTSSPNKLIDILLDAGLLRFDNTTSGTVELLHLDVDNALVLAKGTTDASNTTTGALQSAGGLGVAKAGWFGGNVTITNTAPSLVLTDTTASAKSLTIIVDANAVNIRESAGAAGSLLVLDLANNRIGIGTASPGNILQINDTAANRFVVQTTGRFHIGEPTGNNSANSVINIATDEPNLSYGATLNLEDTRAVALGIGSRILLGSRYDTNLLTGGALIAAYKETATSGQYGYSLILGARENGQDVGEKVRITGVGNVGIGTATFGTNAAKVLAIANGTAPSTAPANEIQIYSKDSSAGSANATLSLELEQTTEAIGTFTADEKIRVWINGKEYYIQLDSV